MAAVAAIIIAAIAVATLTACRDAIDVHNSVTITNDARYRAFQITTATFELDLVKGHSVASWANAFGIASIVEVDIAEADISGFIDDGPAASTDGLTAFQAIIKTSITIAIVSIATPIIVITDRAIAAIVDAQTDCTVSGLDRDTAREGWTALTMFGERGRCEEQRRRKS